MKYAQSFINTYYIYKISWRFDKFWSWPATLNNYSYNFIIRFHENWVISRFINARLLCQKERYSSRCLMSTKPLTAKDKLKWIGPGRWSPIQEIKMYLLCDVSLAGVGIFVIPDISKRIGVDVFCVLTSLLTSRRKRTSSVAFVSGLFSGMAFTRDPRCAS